MGFQFRIHYVGPEAGCYDDFGVSVLSTPGAAEALPTGDPCIFHANLQKSRFVLIAVPAPPLLRHSVEQRDPPAGPGA